MTESIGIPKSLQDKIDKSCISEQEKVAIAASFVETKSKTANVLVENFSGDKDLLLSTQGVVAVIADDKATKPTEK